MMEDSLGVKVLVVAVERIEGDDPHQFSLGIFNKYGIGDAKTNRGLVLTLATLDRSYRITTGYGMEGDLPDAICSRIGTRTMLPRLKEGDWDGAVYSAVDTIYTILARGAVVGDEGWQGDSGFSFAWFFDLSYTERLLVGSLLLFFAALGLRILLFFPNRIYLSFHDKKKVRVKHPNRATGFLLDFRASFWDTGNSYWCLKNGLPHFYDVNGFPWLNVVLFLITIPFKGGGGGSFYGSRGGGRSGGGGAGGRF